MTKKIVEDEAPRPQPSKKDKKKWCGGKKGRQHEYKWQPTKSYGGSSELVCQKCGRIDDYCWSFRFFRESCKCGLDHHRFNKS